MIFIFVISIYNTHNDLLIVLGISCIPYYFRFLVSCRRPPHLSDAEQHRLERSITTESLVQNLCSLFMLLSSFYLLTRFLLLNKKFTDNTSTAIEKMAALCVDINLGFVDKKNILLLCRSLP